MTLPLSGLWVLALLSGLTFGLGVYAFIPHRNFGWQVEGGKPWIDTRASGRNRVGDWQFQSALTNFGIPHGILEVTHPAGIRKAELDSWVSLEVRVPKGESFHLHLEKISLSYPGLEGGPLAGEATAALFGEGPALWNGKACGPEISRQPLELPLDVVIPKGGRTISISLPWHFSSHLRGQKKIAEVLTLSARANGQAVEIGERFELKYVSHYTEFEVLMGI